MEKSILIYISFRNDPSPPLEFKSKRCSSTKRLRRVITESDILMKYSDRGLTGSVHRSRIK